MSKSIGPFDALFGFLSLFDWITPSVQIVREVSKDVPKMLRREPVDWSVSIHGADLPKAMNILGNCGVSHGILDIHIPPFYPLNPWKSVRVPNEKIEDVLLAFNMQGIRYKC